jgi:two-component system phosphate regulon response regulator PhoB
MSGPAKVLVIDDSLTIRKVVELTLRKAPVTCEYAQSGTEGLARAYANPPDIVLLDFLLPDMRGLDVCEALSRDPRTKGSVIVLMTGKDETIREQFRSYPQVRGYLRKPFTGPELLAQIEAPVAATTAAPAPAQVPAASVAAAAAVVVVVRSS